MARLGIGLAVVLKVSVERSPDTKIGSLVFCYEKKLFQEDLQI